jgi:hypothetical protein
VKTVAPSRAVGSPRGDECYGGWREQTVSTLSRLGQFERSRVELH